MAKKKTEEVKKDPERLKKLKLTMDTIEKDFGKGTIMMLGDKPDNDIEVVSTGSLGLDVALGVHGIPKGRIIEIYGPESGGKTTMAMHIIAQVQLKGGTAAFIDVEHAFDESYATRLGINTNDLIINQPDYAEQALEIADRLVESGSVDIVVIDSVAALVPKAELEGEVGDTKMGLQARLMGQTLRKLTAKTSKANCIVIFINQMREKIGVMFGNPETTSGGNALKYYSSIRLDVRKVAVLKDGDEAIGNRVKVKVVKNKVAPPFKTAEFDLIFGQGIDSTGEIIDVAVELLIINKSGAWYSYESDKLGQGRDSVRDLLLDNPDLLKEIKEKVIAKINS